MGNDSRGKDWRVTAALAALSLVFFVLGLVISVRLSPEVGGGIAGRSTLYGLVALLIIGVLLQSSHTPHAWPIACCATASVFMAVLIYMSKTMADARDQALAGYAAEQTLMTKAANGEPIDPTQYPEPTFGRFAPTLAAMSLDLSGFQRRKSDLEAKQKGVGPLGLDSPVTFTDAAKRAAASKQIALLREVDTAALKNEQDLVEAIHADIESSPWPPDEKRELIAMFDKRAEESIKKLDPYFKLALDIDTLDEDMLNVAASDHARLGEHGMLFNTRPGLERFQTDAAKVKALSQKLDQMRGRPLKGQPPVPQEKPVPGKK